MELMQKFFNYIASRNDTMIMLWEKETGWQATKKECQILKYENSAPLTLDGINDLVHNKDKAVFKIFIDKINKAMIDINYNFENTTEKMSIAVRLLGYNDYQHCNIECWFEREKGILSRIFVMISPLDATETYRVSIAEKFTSDRDPKIINDQAIRLIQANPNKKFAVIQFDVVKFKIINQQYGEKKGDELLQFFISSLKVICDNLQFYSRLSADVFMIITPYETEQDIYDFINLLDKYLLGYDNMSYSIVYGVCYIGDLSGGLRQYGDSAAMARQNLKGNALHNIAFYREEIKQNLFSQKTIEDQMENALANNQFVMYLQPKCEIHEGKIVGAEALVRWIHPDLGIVPPIKFIPIFEKNGFILKLDSYIWEEACKKIYQWIKDGKTPIPISVNVSRKHLINMEFINILNSLINKYKIPKKYLEIEITETIEENTIKESIEQLKNNGYVLLMDDFGSGYSSLNTLKNTQFDIIKLDKGFLQDFSTTDRGQNIVKHTINMINDIGMGIVAEGVETLNQAEFLQQCGCNIAQGYYYDKPLSADIFDKKYIL